MPMPELRGMLTAMVTAFAADGSVDEAATVAIGRHLLDNGSDGLVVCGTTGEAATMTDEEHLGVVRLVCEEFADEALIVAGVGSNDTRHAVHLTEQAAALGCHGLLSVTPYYNKPSERGIKAHFAEVARAAGGVPVIVYNIPARTAVNMGPELLAELAQIDGIDGVKQSNNDELRLIDGLAVFAGNDEALARTIHMGGAGGICVSSHIVGNEMKELISLEGDQLFQADSLLHDVYATMFITSSPAPVKAALEMLGHSVGGLRLPLVECDEGERALIRDCLERHNLLSPVS
jgi:4-hydroxy-tetrahydrodipicolinate synthase